ncbi:MAG: energy-dependent translational throttle protein EttA [Halobacteriovoraceae bacterium]|nr:energy-dependent translational throttle protein EttA [Halobacteriovoraceae bacterium]
MEKNDSPANEKQIIYSMNRVGKVFKQKHVLKDISLSYFYGAKIGVLGLNGAGKSTLLRIMAGLDEDHLGETTKSKGYSVGFLEQEPALDPDKTVRDIVSEGVQQVMDDLKEFEDISMKFSEPMSDDEMNALLDKQAKLQDRLDASNAWDIDSRLDLAMEALRCPPSDQKCGVLSGGEKRRVALCRLLLKEPDILLLDEPTNHLDAETVYWLERHLQNYKGTVIAVTHDRYFLDNVAGWILELDRGKGIPFEGNYTSWLEQKQNRLAQEEKTESKKQKALKEELEWIRSSPKARQSKSKARIKDYEQRVNENNEKYSETNEIFIPSGPRLGDIVIEANSVKKAFGDKVLYEDLNFKLPPGGIVGIIGPNGAGKTTLFKMIMGKEQPDEGTFRIGDTVKLAYVDQGRELDPNKTIVDVVSGGTELIKLGNKEVNARAYIGKFNFTGEDQKKKVSELSGGERNRVHLACTLKEEGNVLLLDEPTNDLDVNTLQALEKALVDFAGCAVVISHDRFFLDRIATHILAFEGDSQVTWFDGNFSEYEEDKRKRLGDQALEPKRISYKKLKRD